MDILLASLSIFLIIFIVPILVYGVFAKYFGVQEPEKKLRFFGGVALQKAATVFGFVALFVFSGDVLDQYWPVYGIIWFVMFALTEFGQLLVSKYSKKEAVAGIVSEAIYFPLAAFAAHTTL